ncbi:MAG: OmpA family protein [Paludibacteraceae bacterium]|nr:OmpA family protein [Paludibacteraceae bacterium]
MKRNNLCLLILLCLSSIVYAAKEDQKHYITAEGGLGYSALMYKNLPDAKWKGFLGGNLQVGYEWHYKRFMLHTGLELSSINSWNTRGDFSDHQLMDYTDPTGTYKLDETFAFSKYTERQAMGQVNIPLMFGGKFGNFYFLAGAKAGLPVWGTAATYTRLSTSATFDDLIGEMKNFESHDLYTADEKKTHSFKKSFYNIQASAEIGMYLDQYMPNNALALNNNKKTPVSYRLSVFADYGITPCVETSADKANTVTNMAYPRQFTLNSIYTTGKVNVNSLLVGVKFAVLFDLTKAPKKQLQGTGTVIPSFLIVHAKDAATGELLAGTNASITNMRSGKTTIRQKPMPKGELKQKMSRGDYEVTIAKENYSSETRAFSITQPGDTAEFSVMLRLLKFFRLHVTNGNTGEPLMVTASIVNTHTYQEGASLKTDSVNGNASAALTPGDYKIVINQIGYEEFTAPLASITDSMNVQLHPIKKGQKVVIDNLFFATNKTRILPTSEEALNNVYLFLKENPSVRIRIVGHTDNVGSDESNQVLSEGRAEAVKADMVSRGIDASRMETLGKGETEPVATNDTEEGRQLNRRVEFVIL